MKNRIIFLVLAISVFTAVFASGCSKLLGNLRRDLDDGEVDPGPSMGGRWTEGGMLADDMSGSDDERFVSVGHNDRRPASDDMGGTGGRGSWLNQRNVDSNRRDLYRGAEETAFSNTSSVAPPVKRLYKNGNRATRSDFVDEGTNEGSLWASDGQTNYYFTKNKIRGVGDIVTINMEADLIRDSAAQIGRTLSQKEKEAEIELAQERLKNKAAGIEDSSDKKDSVASSSSSASRTPASEKDKSEKDKKDTEKTEVRKATWADVDIGKSLDVKAGDPIMAEIVERFPNGNYKLRGTKKVRYQNGFRYVNLLGIAKGTDISEEDKIESGKLYEYKLEAVR